MREPMGCHWTQREIFHMSSGCPLKGEPQEHVSTYQILCNGKPVKVHRNRVAGGPPNYEVKVDVLVASDGSGKELDIRYLKTAEIHSWLNELSPAGNGEPRQTIRPRADRPKTKNRAGVNK